MQKRAGLMGSCCAILDCFTDQMRSSKKLSESFKLLGNEKGMLLHEFMVCVYSTFPEEASLKLGSNRTH